MILNVILEYSQIINNKRHFEWLNKVYFCAVRRKRALKIFNAIGKARLDVFIVSKGLKCSVKKTLKIQN